MRKPDLTAAVEILRSAMPPSQSLDEDSARHQIELVRAACEKHEEEPRVFLTPADRRRKLTRLEHALQIVARARSNPQLKDAVKGLPAAAIAGAAENARLMAEKSRRGRGKHGGSLPPHVLEQLTVVYSNVTRRKPTSTAEGKFHQFVCACLAEFGYPVSSETVRALIKRQRRARPSEPQSKPQPLPR